MKSKFGKFLAVSALALVAGALMFPNQRMVETDRRIGKKKVGRESNGAANQGVAQPIPLTVKTDSYPKATSAKVNELFNFQPDGFGSAWKQISDTFEPEEERTLFLRQIAIRMSGMGHPDEAIDMIVKTFGDGETRTQMIAACFAYSQNLDILKKCYGLLKYEGEQRAARIASASCLATAMSKSNGILKFKECNLEFLEKDETQVWISAAEQYLIKTQRNSPNDVASSFGKIMRMELPDGMKAGLLAQLSEIVPILAWQEYVKSDLAASGLDEAKLIVRQMVERDSAAAIAEVLKSPGSEALLGVALNYWGSKDSQAASKWLSENGPGLSIKQYDSALVGVAELLAKKQNFTEASQLVSKIDDANVKSEAERVVWNAERDSLRENVRRDPAGALQSITSGQSKYADYWLEEAMGTWVAKDIDKAQAWYQQNWKSLPASKSQYLAAAFANQATQQGDVATARQWAALIQDEKTRDRINAGIATAEAHPKP